MDLLLRGEAPHEHQQLLLRMPLGEALAHLGGGEVRMEGLRVHAAPHHVEVLDALGGELGAHRLGGGDVDVGQGMVAPDLPPHRALAPRPRPVQVQVAGDVGVIARDQRDPLAVRGERPRGGQQQRLRGMDHVRVEAADDAVHGGVGQREAPMLVERQGHGPDPHHPRAVMLGHAELRSDDHDLVAEIPEPFDGVAQARHHAVDGGQEGLRDDRDLHGAAVTSR